MTSMFTPDYREEHYRPIVHAYYDRANMPATTPPDEPMHIHAICEIMYVSQGETTIAVDDAMVPLRARQFIWLDANVPHRNVLNPKHNGMLNIEYNVEACAPSGLSFRSMCEASAPVRHMFAAPTRYFVLDDLDGTVFSLLKQTVSLADSEHAQAQQLCSMLTAMLLLLMARRRHSEDPLLALTVDNAHINETLRRIHGGYDEALTVRQLAREQGLHPTYLSALFKQTMGKTPAQYIQALRMEHAAQLLRSTDYSILRIATAVGYTGQQYFNRAFRKHFGETPSGYRRRCDEGRV